jgi:putative ABC transport system ATP-binding protein
MPVRLELRGVSKTYRNGGQPTEVLHDISLSAVPGTVTALLGRSGCGKTTLLHLAGAMDFPTAGDVLIDGRVTSTLSDAELTTLRRTRVGFVFQFFQLLPTLTALENVELPLKLTNLKKAERQEHAITALKLVGLGDRLHHLPRQLSGGQEQRVAIARAIVTDPALILADEPTGNLDSASAQDVRTILSRLNKEFGKTIVMVTHDPSAAHDATVLHHLEKGELTT